MKKYIKIICALWLTAVIVFVLLEFSRVNNIFDNFSRIGLLFESFINILILKDKKYLLFVLFWLLILMGIISSIISIIQRKKDLLMILYFVLCIYIISFSLPNNILERTYMKKYENHLLQLFSLFFFILSFAFFISYFGMRNLTFIKEFSKIRSKKEEKINIENENVEKVVCKVDNIGTKVKKAETLRRIELKSLFHSPRNDEMISNLSLAKEDVDMGNGETNIKPVFIIGPDGEKIYPGRTFLDRIIAADPELVQQYSDLKNLFLSYRKVHTRVSKTNDAFRFEGKLIGKIIVAGKGLKVYLALDPFSVDSAIYHQRDASGKKKFVETPLVVKVKSPLSFRKASKLIALACENVTVKKTRYTPKDWTKVDTIDDEDNID